MAMNDCFLHQTIHIMSFGLYKPNAKFQISLVSMRWTVATKLILIACYDNVANSSGILLIIWCRIIYPPDLFWRILDHNRASNLYRTQLVTHILNMYKNDCHSTIRSKHMFLGIHCVNVSVEWSTKCLTFLTSKRENVEYFIRQAYINSMREL